MIFPSTRFFNYIGPSEMISPPPLPLCSSWLPLSRILLFMTLLSVPLNSLSTPLPSLSASHPKSLHFSNSLDFSEGDPPDCDGGSKSRYHALVCWLWNAHISLPDEQFREGIFTIDINDMKCTNFQVSSLSSISTPSQPEKNPLLTIDLKGMSASCTGKYDVSGIGMSGNVVASVSSTKGPLHLQFDIASAPLSEFKKYNNHDTSGESFQGDDPNNKMNLPFPSKVTVSSCESKLSVQDLKFTGSASAKIIDLFSGAISKQVTSALNGAVCPLIKSGEESMLNRSLRAAGMYVASLIEESSVGINAFYSGGSAVGVIDKGMEGQDIDMAKSPDIMVSEGVDTMLSIEDNVIRWDRDVPFLKRVLLGINSFVSNHLNEGIALKILHKISTWNITTNDCEDCGFFFKGVNGLVHSLTQAFGLLEFAIPETFFNIHNNHTFTIDKYGEVVLTAKRLKINGLDNITHLSLFHPTGENMMYSAVTSDAGFNVTVLMEVEVKPVEGGVFKGDALHETFELKLNTSELSFSSQSSLAFDREMFNKLTIGSFKYGSYTEYEGNRNPLNCIFETLSSASVTAMKARVNLNAIDVVPVISAEAKSAFILEGCIDRLINNVLKLILLEYPATATETVDGLVKGPVQDALNGVLKNLITSTKKYPLHCVNVEIPKRRSRPFYFDSSKAIIMFDKIVNQPGALTAVNTFLGCIGTFVDSKNLLSGIFFNYTLGDTIFYFHDLTHENLSQVSEIGLLKPDIDSYHVKNSLGYGTCYAHNDTNEFSCHSPSVSFAIDLVHSNRGRIGTINVNVKSNNIQIQGGAEIQFDLHWLPFLTISDMLARPQCLSTPATELSLYGFNASMGALELQLDVELISEDGTTKFYTYKTDNPSKLASLVSILLSRGAYLLQEKWGDYLSISMDDSTHSCTTPVNSNRKFAAEHYSRSAGFFTVLIIFAFIVGNAWLFLRGLKKNSEGINSYHMLQNRDATNRKGQNREGQQFTSLIEPLIDDQDEMNEVMEVDSPPRKFPFASSSSLMFHQSINFWVRYSFPAVLALGIVLFLASNFSVGASVDLLATKANGDNLTPLINIYSFSLGTTMREMAHAGVYILMLLIFFCSGVWPYVKILLMAYSWMASTRRLRPTRREKILHLLDSLGKFSLIDAFVLVLMMVAFRYQLEIIDVGALDVYVTPQFGFYSFLFATIVSLVCGHAMLFFHRRSMLPSIPVYSGRYESLSKHIFDDKHGRGLVKLSKRFRRMIAFGIFLSFALIVVGCFLPSFHFEFTGLAGSTLGASRIRDFSLVSIGQHLPHSVQGSSFGIYWIQTSYFFFALVMPLLCLVSLFVLFIVPLKMRQQQQLFMLSEVANAWGAIEVFLIAIIASLIEITPFSDTMVGEQCGLANKILSGWSGSDSNDLDHCFSVKSSIDGSSTVLIVGVLLNSFLISILHRLAHHAIWERVEREDRPNTNEDESKNVRECVLSHTFVSRLRKSRLGNLIFEEISFGPHSEYEIDFENVAEKDDNNSANFWSEWRKIVSVI